MGNNNPGVIAFEKYEVVKVTFERNDFYNGEEVNVDVKVNANVKSNEDGNAMLVELGLKVFEHAKENGYPFEMFVLVRGYFGKENGDDIAKFQANAIAILYPYARAIVSSYTANANVTPLILPTVNVNQMLQSARDKDIRK